MSSSNIHEVYHTWIFQICKISAQIGRFLRVKKRHKFYTQQEDPGMYLMYIHPREGNNRYPKRQHIFEAAAGDTFFQPAHAGSSCLASISSKFQGAY